MTTIAVIGAGIAGLSLARILSEQADVTVFEKSRGLGGRMATRRAEAFVFDHGAPYFRAITPRFIAQVDQMRAAGVADIWPARFAEIRNGQIVDARQWGDTPPHFVGTPSMSEIGKFLARGLTIHNEHKLIGAQHMDGRWVLEFDGSGPCGQSFDLLIFAIPAPQVAAILPDNMKLIVPAVETPMTGCFALMLGFEGTLDLPFDAALIDDPTLSWLSVETSKPGRTSAASLTVLSRNDWAQAHMEDDVTQVQAQMLQALHAIGPTTALKPIHQNIHRWRYANAASRRHADVIFDTDHKIGLCGDWCEGGRVESAFSAGVRLADHILNAAGLPDVH